jgi:hypothetical protein
VLLEFPEELDPPVLVDPVEELDEGGLEEEEVLLEFPEEEEEEEEEEVEGGLEVEGEGGGGARKNSGLVTSAVWLNMGSVVADATNNTAARRERIRIFYIIECYFFLDQERRINNYSEPHNK